MNNNIWVGNYNNTVNYDNVIYNVPTLVQLSNTNNLIGSYTVNNQVIQFRALGFNSASLGRSTILQDFDSNIWTITTNQKEGNNGAEYAISYLTKINKYGEILLFTSYNYVINNFILTPYNTIYANFAQLINLDLYYELTSINQYFVNINQNGQIINTTLDTNAASYPYNNNGNYYASPYKSMLFLNENILITDYTNNTNLLRIRIVSPSTFNTINQYIYTDLSYYQGIQYLSNVAITSDNYIWLLQMPTDTTLNLLKFDPYLNNLLETIDISYAIPSYIISIIVDNDDNFWISTISNITTGYNVAYYINQEGTILAQTNFGSETNVPYVNVNSSISSDNTLWAINGSDNYIWNINNSGIILGKYECNSLPSIIYTNNNYKQLPRFYNKKSLSYDSNYQLNCHDCKVRKGYYTLK